jgi:flagellar basal body-associated protein FliL
LEDYKREMDSDKKEIGPIKEKTINPRELTVMLIRSVGKPHSFKISRRIILWTSLIFLAYMLVSLYALSHFFYLQNRYNTQSEKFEQLKKEHDENLKALNLTKEYATGLEEYIKNIDKPKKEETTTKTVDVIKADSDKKDEVRQRPQRTVEIKDAIIHKEGSGMSVDFTLVNTIPEENAIEGYLHIIAMDAKNDYPQEWSYARDKIKDGFPVDFRLGQSFFIQRFKSYHRQFNVSSNSGLPKTIRVLVYDRSGELILKKEFEVDNAS